MLWPHDRRNGSALRNSLRVVWAMTKAGEEERTVRGFAKHGPAQHVEAASSARKSAPSPL